MFLNNQFNSVIYLIKKNISIKVLEEALGVKDDAEGAEYDYLEEANIGKMDDLFETESLVSCPYCQELFSNNKEVLKYMEVH